MNTRRTLVEMRADLIASIDSLTTVLAKVDEEIVAHEVAHQVEAMERRSKLREVNGGDAA